MQATVQFGILTPFEASFGTSGLAVRASIYETTSGAAVFLSYVVMADLTGTYLGFFTPGLNRTYLIVKIVYTDLTYATEDSDYSRSSETLEARDLSPAGTPGMEGVCKLNVQFKSSILGILFKTSIFNIPLASSSLNIPLESSTLNIPLTSPNLNVLFKSSSLNVPIESSTLNIPLESSSLGIEILSSELNVAVHCA